MKKPIIYVDMDDTLCQFTKAVIEQRTNEISIPWCKLDFFRKLEPMPGAIDSINKLSEFYDIWILTRPSIHNPISYMEKRLWIEDNMGFEWCKKLIICPDKTMVKPGILIDDIDWISNGYDGEQILFGSDLFPNWEHIIEYFKHKKIIK